ncbi:MAG: hypothetical protein ACKODP_04535 [Actinomycetota bacterium]
MTAPRILAIMGSGETAPTMVSTHRSLVARLGSPVRATVIDTPYGFQENSGDLAERAVAYFRKSVNIDITVAGLLRLHGAGLDPVSVERGLRHVSDAGYVFAGPGSPTYALRQWTDTPLRGILEGKLRDGGIVTFASAAALTLGSHTVPVYEIYKVGEEPRWERGLDLLGTLGINAAVIPHYDNAEGGNHDTRFCYLGAARLERLEQELPEGHFVLGIDEHTGLVLDLGSEEATVTGRGGVTVRVRGAERVFPAGESFGIDVLRNPGEVQGTAPARSASVASRPGSAQESTSPDDGTAARHVDAFRAALGSRDVDGAVRAALALEQDAGDLAGADLAAARAELRSMISGLGDAAVAGMQDPREVVGPYVEAMLAVRATVRAEKRYDLSDVIRDAFDALGVEVRDTPSGVEWALRA